MTGVPGVPVGEFAPLVKPLSYLRQTVDVDTRLDGDEEVTLFDFGILVRNFGEFGDD